MHCQIDVQEEMEDAHPPETHDDHERNDEGDPTSKRQQNADEVEEASLNEEVYPFSARMSSTHFFSHRAHGALSVLLLRAVWRSCFAFRLHAALTINIVPL